VRLPARCNTATSCALTAGILTERAHHTPQHCSSALRPSAQTQICQASFGSRGAYRLGPMGPAGRGRARLQRQRGGVLGDQEVGEVDEEGQEGVEAQHGQEPWRAPGNPASAHAPSAELASRRHGGTSAPGPGRHAAASVVADDLEKKGKENDHDMSRVTTIYMYCFICFIPTRTDGHASRHATGSSTDYPLPAKHAAPP